VAEGEDLVQAALDHGARPVALLLDEERLEDVRPLLEATGDLAERYAVPPRLLTRASGLAAPPRAMAVLPQPGPNHFRTVAFPPRMALYLAGVADPGNVGTLVRTAAALGCDWLALGPGSADPYHPRAVRAAMGATYALPLLEGVAAGDLATREGFAVVAAVAEGGAPPWSVDLTGPTVIALGAERAGLAPVLGELGQLADAASANWPNDRRPTLVTIPQAPGAESLNVAAAGAALLAEALRQRLVT
jgi:TrmH family RNA methyltransferase